MGAGDDFERRIEIIESFVEEIGDEVVDDIEGYTTGGGEVGGFQCKHGDHHYFAMTSTDQVSLMLRYDVDADSLYHAYTTDSVRDPDETHIEVEIEDAESAREELERELQGQPAVDKRELRLNLKQVISREGCSVQFDTGSTPYNIHGFEITRLVFPDHEGFLIGDFHEAVQNVINFGWIGQDLLVEYYGLAPDTFSGSPGYSP